MPWDQDTKAASSCGIKLPPELRCRIVKYLSEMAFESIPDCDTDIDYQPSIQQNGRFVHPWPFKLPGFYEFGRLAKLKAENYWNGHQNLPYSEEVLNEVHQVLQ